MKKILVIAVVSVIFAFLFSEEQVVDLKIVNSQIEATFNIPEHHHQTLQKDYFYLDADEIEGIGFEETVYPKGKLDKDGNIEYNERVKLVKKFTISAEFAGEAKVKIYAGYQFCRDSGSCLFPEEIEFEIDLRSHSSASVKSDREMSSDLKFEELQPKLEEFTVVGKAAGYRKTDKFVNFLKKSKTAEGESGNPFAEKSIWLVIVLILVGGIALNLTPCVLPMIPITIAVLGAGTQSESKGKGFLIGGVYGLGMSLAYGLLGIIVVLTGSQFGTLNSSPWFNIIIAAVFIVLALAMFDIIAIDFTKLQKGTQKQSKSKFITVFIMGIIAAILAGACVAPVLIAVILYSTSLYTAGNPAGLLLPFLLGIGMAIPWPFAGAGLSVLPKPGNWMKWIKIIFGIIILIIALYYGYLGIELFSSGSEHSEKIETAEHESDLPWQHSLPEALELSKKEDKPILIDFWATWCKNCLMMDATTFKSEEFAEISKDFILLKYQAENMKISPTKEILDYYKVIGLPTYIVLKPDGDQK